MEKIYEKVLCLKNKPFFEQRIIYKNHKIFYKYTSNKYYKYIFNLLDTLCKRSPYENKSYIFHLSLSFILRILYNCENTPYLSNLDLIILNCFSLGIKSLIKQKLFPSINKLKKIYEEKFSNYNRNEIVEGEIICLKLINYNINLLTPFEYIEYIIYDISDISFKKKVFENLENLMLNELEYFLYNKPFDIASRCINEVNNKLLIKEPKIITTKIISTKIIKDNNNIKKYSSSDKMINSNDLNQKTKYNGLIIEKLKKATNISNFKYRKNCAINNFNVLKMKTKGSPERIYYKKYYNCNILHQNSSGSIITEKNLENSDTNKSKIFKKKINKSSVSNNKYIFKSNVMDSKFNNNDNEIFQKKLHLNSKNKVINRSFNEKHLLSMSNTQYLRNTNNMKSYQDNKENDGNYLNIYLQTKNFGKNNINNSIKFSVENANIYNLYKNDRTLKYENEGKNIKLGYLNQKYLFGSDYKKDNNNDSRIIKLHSQLNSSINNFDSSIYSKDGNIFENQSIGNYYIKW